jgi:transposase
MEIVSSKASKSNRKRKAETNLRDSFCPQTPLKRTKITPSSSSYKQMTLTEKSKIYLSRKEGHKVSTITREVQKSRTAVTSFLKRAITFKEFTTKHHLKGRWRKGDTKLDSRHKKFINKWLQEDTVNSSRQIWRRLNNTKNLKKISYNPVNKYIKTLGGFVKPTMKPVVSQKNKEKRVEYCRQYRNFNMKNVLFTDESSFQLNSNTLKVFVKKGQARPRVNRYNPNYKIMVWGGISHYGKTALKIIEGTLNGESYRKLVLRGKRAEVKRFMGSRRWWFQQDRAPCHRQKLTIDFIKRNITKNILPHPAQSPDLNPIELVWARMKVFVERKRPKSKSELREAILQAWDDVDLSFIRSCVGGLKVRMRKIIDSGGNIL